MGLGEFWGQTELNPHIYHLLSCLTWGMLVWNCASVSFFVKWDKTACLRFVMRIKGDHYIPLTSPWTWHIVNCQYTWHYDQASQPSKRRWLWKSPTVIPLLQNWRNRLRKWLAWSHPENCNRAKVELNHPLLSPEISASSQPTVLSLS